MNDKKARPKRRVGCWIVGLFLLLLIGAVGASYAMGWVSFHRGDGTFTIEIKTGEARTDTDQAVEQGKRAVEQTGKAIQETGKAVQEAGKQIEKLGGDTTGALPQRVNAAKLLPDQNTKASSDKGSPDNTPPSQDQESSDSES